MNKTIEFYGLLVNVLLKKIGANLDQYTDPHLRKNGANHHC